MTPIQQRNVVARLVAQQVAAQAEQIRIQTTQQIYAAVLIVLQSKHGFTPYSLKRVLEQVTEQFECIADKYVKIEDFYELLGEMGIKVK